MNIKDFILAFKIAYNQLNEEKEEAKGQIAYINQKIEKYKNTINNINTIKELLTDVYTYLPQSQRSDYVSKTLKLFEYGYYPNKNSVQINLQETYNQLIYKLKKYAIQMNHAYKQKHYKTVTELFNETIKYEEDYIKNYLI